MENTYNINGLVFWNEEEIRQREYFRDFFAKRMQAALVETNPAWRMMMVEAPLLTPWWILNENYTNQDIWLQQDMDSLDDHGISDPAEMLKVYPEFGRRGLALRPETTPGSYFYAVDLLNNHTGVKPPFVVWQAGKSFRREIVQPTKHMRLKEFYQQEFQCIYTADSANDYHTAMLEPVRKMIADVINLPSRIVPSDRLPAYSQKTMDVEVDNGDKWMEVCSISLRTDFPEKAKFQGKHGLIEKDLMVVEVAIGLDRVLYNWQQARRS
jgi:glycyl-tRNA synthetase